MALQTTQNLPAPYIESELKAFLPEAGKAGATDTTSQLGLPSLAPESAFTQQARKTGAGQAGLAYDTTTGALTSGTGVASYQPYLTTAGTYADPSTTAGQTALQSFISPHQNYVIDAMTDATTAAKNRASAQALDVGAFGGGRHGIQSGIMDAELAKNIGLFKGTQYQDALTQMGTASDRQRNLATDAQTLGIGNMGMLGQLGAGQLGYAQAGLDTTAQAAEMKRQEPFNRLGWYGGQLSQLMGGMPNPYMQTSPAASAPSPFMQALGSGVGAYGLGGILGQIWNRG